MRFPLNKLLAEHLLTQFRQLERSPGSQESPVWSLVVSLGEQPEICPRHVCRMGKSSPPCSTSDRAWKFPKTHKNVLLAAMTRLLRTNISVPMS